MARELRCSLYDTLLKKDHDLLALLTAVASFVLLALQIEYMRKGKTGRGSRGRRFRIGALIRAVRDIGWRRRSH